ncbi:MAG: response regulator [Lysobacterales bacterium]|jgi:CheY-like chemotaxis protein
MSERTIDRQSRPRVLVVDDHEISRMSTVAALRETAVTVKEAQTFAEAKALALRWLPALICTDLDLGDECGLDLVRELRRDWPPERRAPAFIVISGYLDAAAARGLAALGVHCALIKPLGPGELLRAVTAVSSRLPVPATAPPGERLPELLERELERRLPTLDRLLDAYDLRAATHLLHKLVAASAICGNRRLERSFRELYEACRTRARPESLAGAYFRTLQAVEARWDEVAPE